MKKRARLIGVEDADGKLSLDKTTLEVRLLRVRSHVRAGLMGPGGFPGPVPRAPCDQATSSHLPV